MKRYLILLLLTLQGAFAQVEFKAVPSKTSLGINERLRVEFTMSSDGDNFNPPSFQGFKVSGPSQMISNSWINGKHTFSKAYTYILTPTAKGSFTIGQATIEVEGKTYKTSPFKVTVGNAVAEPQQNNNSRYSPYDPFGQQQQEAPPKGDGIHLVAEISKTSPYVNEPVTVVYKLYVSHTTSVTGWRETASPQYNDFWSQSIDVKKLVVEEGKYQGENYRYVVLRKTVLYPQKSGRLEIEPLSLNIDLEAPTGRRDWFGRPEYAPSNKVVSAGKKFINVKALPEAGKPADFTGAVGDLSFKVTPSKTTLKSGESLKLTVSVSGKGNLKLFTLPKPVVPAALEMYDPEHKEDVTTPLSGMEGAISDTYTIVPGNKGKYPIKGMSFSYFNPATGKYKTISSDEIMLNVLQGAAQPGNDSTAVASEQVKITEPFAFIALNTRLQPMDKAQFFGSGLFFSLLAAPFLMIPLIIAFRRRKEAIDRDVAGNRMRQSNKLARKYLGDAKKQLGNKEPFYIALERALHNFLKAKLNIETSEMSKDRIQELLLSRNARPETVNEFIALMNSCEFARYAPSSDTAMQKDYDTAVNVITALEKQM